MKIDRRQLVTGGIALATASTMIRAGSALADAPLSLPPEYLIHPELRSIVPTIVQFSSKMPPLNRANLPEHRKPNPLATQTMLDDVPHESRRIPVGRGYPDVEIFIVNARAGSSRPAILHTHGGGYVTGTAKGSVHQLQELCKTLDCVAVSVDYRLAPETTYAGSIEDNYAGLKWLYAHAAELGADPKRIAVLGESAGGGHAALLAITARDRGEVPLCFQCLIYPMLDDRTGTSRKVPPFVGTLIWTAENNRFGWESFLGTKAGGVSAPKGAVPARVANLGGLPPAFIGVGTLDLFCDEDIDYAQRLNQAGVMTELLVVPGAFHGFDGIGKFTKAKVSDWFEAAKLDALRRGFGLS